MGEKTGDMIRNYLFSDPNPTGVVWCGRSNWVIHGFEAREFQQINSVARRNFTCDATKKYSVTDLDYPSFAVPFDTA
uniref:Uncharacterized protein n=1 Tax=Nelumbo nucifera TaxID=4432 RepID=A0A823A557_NELNU|nr:TPA_asm: hypothetical protein HUJ06_018905 [Nelumbo nucifera]